MNMFRFVSLITVPCLLLAQEPSTQSTGKRQPDPKPLDTGASAQQKGSSLPTIDLPEFVITGTASIDPPDAQKNLIDASGIYQRNSSNTEGNRERETIDLGQRFKQKLLFGPNGMNGYLLASLGNYFTPTVDAFVGWADPSYDITALASYYRTKGFTRFADASSGRIGIQGSHELITGSSVFTRARIGGAFSLKTDSYKFFGSTSPSKKRDISILDFRVRVASDIEEEGDIESNFQFRSVSLQDSGRTTTENGFGVDLAGTLPVFGFPVQVGGSAMFSTITTVSDHRLSSVSLSVGSRRLSWGTFSLQAGIEGYHITGMNGQEGSYLYPRVLVGLAVSSNHDLFFWYRPDIQVATLEESVAQNPYLLADAPIRHTNSRLRLSGGIESEWNNWLRTKVWIDHKSMVEYPLYADSGSNGEWSLVYGGTTSWTAFNIDGVANIGSNDYFCASVIFRTTRNSLVGDVPYVPGFESSFLWSHRFPFAVVISPRLGFLGTRHADFLGGTVTSAFAAGMKIEYLGISDLTLFVELTNIADQKFENWKGYRAEPFRAAAGLTYRW